MNILNYFVVFFVLKTFQRKSFNLHKNEIYLLLIMEKNVVKQ